jgi:hypothetical protein
MSSLAYAGMDDDSQCRTKKRSDAVLEMRRPPLGRESHRHAHWRLDPPVRVLQLWPSMAFGGSATTSDCGQIAARRCHTKTCPTLMGKPAVLDMQRHHQAPRRQLICTGLSSEVLLCHIRENLRNVREPSVFVLGGMVDLGFPSSLLRWTLIVRAWRPSGATSRARDTHASGSSAERLSKSWSSVTCCSAE